MKHKTFRILFGLSVILIIKSCGLFYTEKLKIKNTVSDEVIYLKYTEGGFDNQSFVISLNSRSSFDTCKDYVDYHNLAIFYKMDKDTLSIYGMNYLVKPGCNKAFKTKIMFYPLKNPEFVELCKNYKSKGLKVFPQKKQEVINNFSQIDERK